MEHPVPQNVTSFEFHLVGDMTLKQFLYLASGIVFAYIIFLSVYAYSPVIALPIMVISAVLGIALAFLPIGDRPLDHWLLSFLKAIYTPTQRHWEGRSDIAKLNRLNLYLNPPKPSLKPQPPIPQSNTAPIMPSIHTPSLTSTQKPVTRIKGISTLLDAPQKPVVPIFRSPQPPVNNQVLQTTVPLPQESPQPLNPNPLPQPSIPTPPQVKADFSAPPLTQSPNLINGVVLDSNQKGVEGAIVIISNPDNIPLRAIKTNKMGQFTGATPLPEGEYNLTIEKEGLSYPSVSLKLDNKVMPGLIVKPIPTITT